MNTPAGDTFTALERLFSIVFRFGDELRIESASAVALAQMPWLAERPRLTDVFDVVRPQGIAGAGDVLERGGQHVGARRSNGHQQPRGRAR